MANIKGPFGTFCAFFILAVIIPYVLPANILFFFAGGNISHKISVWPWVLELANRGHNVTFISPHAKTPVAHPNIMDLSAKPLQDLATQTYLVDRFKERDEGTEKNFDYNTLSTHTCKAIVDSREVDPILAPLFKDGKFDLVVVNAIFGECGYYVGHYFHAKTVTYDSCTFITWFYDTYGVSPEAAFIPDLIFKFKTFPMTFMDRAYNTYLTFFWNWYRDYQLSPMLEEVVKPLLKTEQPPTLNQLENNVSIVLINSHPSVDFARTLPPIFVDVGGMASWAPEKELPKNIKDFMDKAGSGGVVLISFGSTVLLNTVSSRHQAMFFHLIHELPNVRFVMRWSGPLPKFLDKAPKNLLVSDWLPQREVLSHPKLRVFITHGGVSSVQEATYYGVPLIVLPLFADQDYNAFRVEAQEVGFRVEIRGMTGDTLVTAVDTILKDKRYKKNMMQKSAIFRDRPQTPVETAVFWTEFTLRHEDTISTFRPQNQHLNMFQRRLLDVYVFFAVVLLLSVVLVFLILKVLLNFACRRNQSVDRSTKTRKLD